MGSLAGDLYLWRVTYRTSQQEAAEEAGVSLTTWSRWERGITRPGEEHYNRLMWVISRPPAWWLAREGTPAA